MPEAMAIGGANLLVRGRFVSTVVLGRVIAWSRVAGSRGMAVLVAGVWNVRHGRPPGVHCAAGYAHCRGNRIER